MLKKVLFLLVLVFSLNACEVEKAKEEHVLYGMGSGVIYYKAYIQE